MSLRKGCFGSGLSADPMAKLPAFQLPDPAAGGIPGLNFAPARPLDGLYPLPECTLHNNPISAALMIATAAHPKIRSGRELARLPITFRSDDKRTTSTSNGGASKPLITADQNSIFIT